MTIVEAEAAQTKAYSPLKPSRSEFIDLRGKRYHIHRWGNPNAPQLFMLHGWMDVAASFQFIVDELADDWSIIAPDWSGYIDSEARQGAYYLTEYLADLDMLLEHYSPNQPATVVAHSMGASIATLYAGVRPERINYLVNIEGVGPIRGMVPHPADMIGDWLTAQREPKQGLFYNSVDDFADKLMRGNKKLSLANALFLAKAFVAPNPEGRYLVQVDESVRAKLPLYLHREQIEEIWQRVSAKMLFLRGSLSFIHKAMEADEGGALASFTHIAHFQEYLFEGATHNMHHEIPRDIAQQIELFIPR